MTQLKVVGGILNNTFMQILAVPAGERVVKISQRLVKTQTRVEGLLFYPPCICRSKLSFFLFWRFL